MRKRTPQPHYSSMIYAKTLIKNSYFLKDDKFWKRGKIRHFQGKGYCLREMVSLRQYLHYQKHGRKDSKTKLQFIYAEKLVKQTVIIQKKTSITYWTHDRTILKISQPSGKGYTPCKIFPLGQKIKLQTT